MLRRNARTTLWLTVLAWITATMVAAGQEPIPNKNAYDVLFPRYLRAAREMARDESSSIQWMVSLSADRRARSVNDLVTIRVIESTVAAGSAAVPSRAPSPPYRGAIPGRWRSFPPSSARRRTASGCGPPALDRSSNLPLLPSISGPHRPHTMQTSGPFHRCRAGGRSGALVAAAPPP